MVKCLSALEPKITSMAPSTWQKVDEWRQWSLFTGQDRCTATLRLVHPTGVALIQDTEEETWWQSSRMPIRNLSCRLLKTWRIWEYQEKKPTFTVFLDITIIQLSSFFVLSSIHCLFFNNQEMQVWYGHDWMDRRERDNGGKTCVDVYALYAWVCPLKTLPLLILKLT